VQGSQGIPLQPGSMLWLIQRDFLQGKTVQQLVGEALAPVPNPQHDKDITELNKIRASLSTIASNSTGTGVWHQLVAFPGSSSSSSSRRRGTTDARVTHCILLIVFMHCAMIRKSWLTAALQEQVCL
jgi:hypothetical protein